MNTLFLKLAICIIIASEFQMAEFGFTKQTIQNVILIYKYHIYVYKNQISSISENNSEF